MNLVAIYLSVTPPLSQCSNKYMYVISSFGVLVFVLLPQCMARRDAKKAK
jgi:hypothetical protein